jgi:hypothetical protein
MAIILYYAVCLHLLKKTPYKPKLSKKVSSGKRAYCSVKKTSNKQNKKRAGITLAQSLYTEHSSLFHQIMAGFLLGDGWLENRSGSVRLGISIIIKFADVAVFLRTLLFGMGYISDFSLDAVPLVRERVNAQTYYQFRTFSFRNLIAFYHLWYEVVNGKLQKSTLP